MQNVYDWTAKRAGGRITIYGTDDKDQPVRLVGVDKIRNGVENGAAGPIATDKNGVEYRLK